MGKNRDTIPQALGAGAFLFLVPLDARPEGARVAGATGHVVGKIWFPEKRITVKRNS